MAIHRTSKARAALAHEPERRYPSAAAFGADLQRHLSSRPVLARPDSRSYRLRKFVNRHRLGVAASIALAATVLAALAISLTLLADARREAQRATAAQAFLTSLFEGMDPARSSGSTPTVRDLLERGSERADRELVSQPEFRAEMQAVLAQVFDQLALPDRGEALWRQSVATRLALFGPRDVRTVKAKKGLAISLARQARYPEAEPLFEELLKHERIIADAREHGSLLLNYGNHKRLTGQYAASAALLERAVALLEVAEPDGRSLGRALNNLGLVYWRDGRERDAVKAIERTQAILIAIEGPRSGGLVPCLINLTLLYRELDELDQAARYGQEAIAVADAAFPAGHPEVGKALEAVWKRHSPARVSRSAETPPHRLVPRAAQLRRIRSLPPAGRRDVRSPSPSRYIGRCASLEPLSRCWRASSSPHRSPPAATARRGRPGRAPSRPLCSPS